MFQGLLAHLTRDPSQAVSLSSAPGWLAFEDDVKGSSGAVSLSEKIWLCNQYDLPLQHARCSLNTTKVVCVVDMGSGSCDVFISFIDEQDLPGPATETDGTYIFDMMSKMSK